jgi:hypothetical protein
MQGLAAALTAILLAFQVSAAEPTLEYPVKATFLYKFGDFVEWPLGSFHAAAAPLQLCILGADPFGNILTEAIVGRHSAGRNIDVRQIQASAEAGACHILFVGKTPAAAEALKAVHSYPVLTVTDEDDGQNAIGVIHFTIRENRVRFIIDDQAAAANNLNISSKLLSIAVAVKPRK